MSELVDRFCPNSHDAPITALCWDPQTGARASADSTGRVAILRRGETVAGFTFQPGGPIQGPLALLKGGNRIAIGDEHGSVGVYRVNNGEAVFRELREPPEGRVRAMRAISISPDGGKLASLAADGLIRLWDLDSARRLNAWKGFGGRSLYFDHNGDRLLCLTDEGQPCLVDLRSQVIRPMDPLQIPAHTAIFTRDNALVVCVGDAGISLLRVADGCLLATFATKGGSGIMGLALAPDDSEAAVVTQRSVHFFSLPELEPVRSQKHGAPDPTGEVIWTGTGVKVAGSDGLLHGEARGPGLKNTTNVSVFGAIRAVAHENQLAIWQGVERLDLRDCGGAIQKLAVDREGNYTAVLPRNRPLVVFRPGEKKPFYTTGNESINAKEIAIGGNIIAAHLKDGGVQWWNMANKQIFKLRWPRGIALSGGGTWLGLITPKGAVRIMDPRTGEYVVKDPVPLADVPVKALTFINRRPEMLILDEDGVLGHYDIAEGIRSGEAPEGTDLLDFNVKIDAMWGISGGRFVALRLPEGDTCTILIVDVDGQEVCLEITGLHCKTWVDLESGHLFEPARSNAIVERDIKGRELRVYRSLPDSEWIAFGPRGIEGASKGAGQAVS